MKINNKVKADKTEGAINIQNIFIPSCKFGLNIAILKKFNTHNSVDIKNGYI